MKAKVKDAPLVVAIPPKIVKEVEEHSCQLNEVEWVNRANELASLHKQVEQTMERKASVMAELNATLKMVKAKETKMANIVASRSEIREVGVETKYDFEAGRVIKTRSDTEEVLTDREMGDNERQIELELYQDANAFIEDAGHAEAFSDEDITEEDLIGDDK